MATPLKVGRLLYPGQTVRVTRIDHDFVELTFDNQHGINRMDAVTLQELRVAISMIVIADRVRGVLVTSQRPGFVADADAAQYAGLLRRPGWASRNMPAGRCIAPAMRCTAGLLEEDGSTRNDSHKR